MSKVWLSISALIAAVVIFVAVNMVAAKTFRSARVDLTEGKLYTLSPGAQRIAASLPEPVTLTLYFSGKASSGQPQITTYATRVRELLREVARASGGKIAFREVDPQPFSEDEDRAAEAGIAPVPLPGSVRIYFGLVGTNAVDKREVIPFFDPGKEEFLEYDVTRLVHLLSDQPRKVVGVMSWLPLKGMQGNPMMGGRGSPPWLIYDELGQLFELKEVANTAAEIPADVKVLLVVHPKAMTEATQYAVDQFVLKGGRAVVFVDPVCESDVPPGLNPMQAMQIPKTSSLPRLLGAWGLEMDTLKVAADKASAVPVTAGQRQDQVSYIAWLFLGKERMNTADPVCAGLQQVMVRTPGALTKKEGATTEVTPLLSTSPGGALIEASSVSMFPEPDKLLAAFKPGDKPLMIACRVTGAAKTAFPEGAPKAEPPKPDPANPDQPPPAPPVAPSGPHVAESQGPIGVIVVADCDVLSDNSWARAQRLGNIDLGWQKFASNGDLVIGMIDNLSGSTDLQGLRARGTFSRPFTRTADLRRDAEQRYHAKEQELQTKLNQTVQRINEIQSRRQDKADTAIVLTAEQRKEMEALQATMVQTRKDLREVRFQLNKEIDALGTAVKAVNIALMPALVGLAAVGLATYRASRREADRRNASGG